MISAPRLGAPLTADQDGEPRWSLAGGGSGITTAAQLMAAALVSVAITKTCDAYDRLLDDLARKRNYT